MEIIAHRRNTTKELNETPREFGIEVDIRSSNGELILQHDAFSPGERLSDWLEVYSHGTLILNVKEEGLEASLISHMKEHNIESFFFLDQSFPFLLRYSHLAEGRAAVRISEYEHIETALRLAGRVDWVWIDYFSKFPLTGSEVRELREAGFQLCAVSPELQGHDASLSVPALRRELEASGIELDAVCTKVASMWMTP